MITEVMSNYEHSKQTAETEVLGDSGNSELHFYPSELVVDGYQIEKRISITGASEVMQALSNETGELVALKVPRTPNAAEMIRREVSVHRAIGQHCFIAAMVGSGTQHGAPFIATRMQEGGTMAGLVRETEVPDQDLDRPELRRRIKLLGHCAAGVAALHSMGFVHRDIKPANIGIGRNDTARLLDLGIADRPLANPEIERIWGTPGESIAPEGYRGEVLSQGDVWAHAVSAYRILTGVPAFEVPEERTVLGFYYKASEGLRYTPRELNDNIPSDLDRIIAESLHPDPHKRPTISELQEVYGRAA